MDSIVYPLIISLAVRMTVAAVFVMLIKLIFRNRLSAGMHCAAWWILFIQLIFCIGNVSIPARTSIYNIVPDAGEVITQAETAHTAASADVSGIAVWIYVSGAFAMALWFAVIFFSFRRSVLRLEVINDPATLEILKDVKKKLDVGDDITLRRGELAQMTGRTVILPDGFSGDEQRNILLHELCHYKNKDNLKLCAALFLLCLNWFNPVIWIAFSVYRNDIEMFCDENVMKVTDSKKEYAKVLIKTASSRSRFIPGATSVSGGRREVKQRVKNIAAWNKKKRVWMIAAALLCVSSCCLCLTDAVSIAVENTVEVIATPEPAAVLTKPTAEPQESGASAVTEPETTEAEDYEPAATPAPVRTKAPEPAAEPVREQSYSYSAPETEAPMAEQKASEETGITAVVTEPESQTEPENDEAASKYPELGTPESVSANGSKETYSLEDGRTAVLHYDGDTLETGYIINSSEESAENNQE